MLSVSIIETKMCLDVVFGSCCLPGMTVDAYVKHEVNWQEAGSSHIYAVNFMHLLLTVSPEENGCKPIISVKLSQSCVSLQGFLRVSSITVPTLPVLEMLEELLSSFLIHTSVKFLPAGSLAFSIKHILSSELLVYRCFS